MRRDAGRKVLSEAFSLSRSLGSLYGMGSRLLDVPQGSSVLVRGLGLLTVQELNGFVEVGWTLSLALAPLSLFLLLLLSLTE